MHRGKTHSLWRKYMKVDFHIGCSQNEKPHVRLTRHRLNKAGRTPSFSILDQDVNNVPPSKQTGNSRWGCTIVFFTSDPQHFLLMACVNKLTLRRASYWMERLIIGTQEAKWKDKGNIPESSHRTRQHCRSAKGFFGKAQFWWVMCDLEESMSKLQSFNNMEGCHVCLGFWHPCIMRVYKQTESIRDPL